MFYIDGMKCGAKCTITRAAEIRSSEISGEMEDGSYFNDVLGTWMSYTIEFEHPLRSMDQYAEIYEAITEPVAGHDFVLPYNGGLIALYGRVSLPEDSYVEWPGGLKYWDGLRFNVIANHPTKQVTLAGVLVRGRAPLPDVTMAAIGDAYRFTSSGWEPIPDGETLYF